MPTGEHLQAIPHPDTGRITVEMDRAGFEVFSRFYKQSIPHPGDHSARDRVWGLLFAAASQMGWTK